MERLTPWQRAITALAVLKVVVAVALYAAAFATKLPQATPRDLLMVAHIAAYGSAAVLLIVPGRRDLRATILGVSFLLTAAVFADNAVKVVGAAPGLVVTTVRALFALQVDAFTGYFLWYFVQEFPRVATFGARAWIPRLGMRVSLAVGVTLFSVNVVYFVASLFPGLSALHGWLRFLARDHNGLYWPLQYMLSISGLLALVWKARAAAITERRRVSLLIGGLVLGTGPTVCWVFLATVWPAFRSAFPLRLAGWVIYPTLLSTPFTTAYAVLVHHALNAPLIVRRAIQYAFARYTVLIAAAIPAVILVITLYRARELRMSDLVVGANGLLLVALVIMTVVASRGRREMLDRVDRRFFREQYDARRILGALVDRCRSATSQSELGDNLRADIDRALHLESLSVLFLDREGTAFDSPVSEIRPLPATSWLAELLAKARGAVEVDLEHGSGIVTVLSTEDRHWLADAGARLLLPMHGPDGRLIGLMVLGKKRSELPFSEEDRMVLATVASAAGLALTYLGAEHAPASHARTQSVLASGAERAAICMVCGWLGENDVTTCERCASPMVRAPVPRLLAGKFRLIEKIGEGGMGVVYRGVDLELDRVVAVKTLPRVLPDEAARWRREGRAMAAIAHPNLALIYGAESWNGMPILIVEFLAGGTLSTRLASGPLGVRDGLTLGLALADVIGALHRAGILHGDVKPSNIGFTTAGAPKLLDFGLARRIRETWPADGERGERVVGTPLYISPEALAGRQPDPSFDLWSICVVLYEAMAGTNPLRDATLAKSLKRIESCSVPDFAQFVPNADAELSAFFRRAFSRNRAERPLTGDALRGELAKLLRRNAAAGTALVA